jgi:multicomponent Na+:H+ antiporter subunit F
MGPTVWDRLLGLVLVSNKIILFSLFVASYYNLAYLMDFVIVYALLGFVGIVFITLYIVKRRKDKDKDKISEKESLNDNS